MSACGRGHVLDNGLKQRRHAIVRIAEIFDGVPVAGAGVNEWGAELLFAGVKFQKQFQHLVVHAMRVGVLTVDLIDDDDDLQALRQSLFQDESGLGLRTVKGVHQQEHAVHHAEDALDFAPKVGVAGSVDDVDCAAAPMDGGILGLDGDPLFLFEVHRVHGAFFHCLIGAVHAAFTQQLVHQRRFAVVDVGDDADISKLVVHEKLRFRPSVTRDGKAIRI